MYFRLTKSRVEPAADEIQNAFDHFATATILAMSIPNMRDAAQCATALTDGLLDVERGRRHIAAGDFQSIQFYIAARVKIAVRLIEKIEGEQKINMNDERQRVIDLGRKGKAVYDPSPIRYAVIDEVVKETNETYGRIATLKRIANELDELYRDIYVEVRR